MRRTWTSQTDGITIHHHQLMKAAKGAGLCAGWAEFKKNRLGDKYQLEGNVPQLLYNTASFLLLIF
jgi:hypothetical protein